jgi:addiction module HigA family antidote
MLREASTPGDVLKHEYLIPTGISAGKLAEALDVDKGIVSRIINGKCAVTANLALRLGKVLGTTPQFWLNLQCQHDVSLAKADPKLVAKLDKLSPMFPSSEQYDD